MPLKPILKKPIVKVNVRVGGGSGANALIITIPKAFRDDWNIQPDDELTIEILDKKKGKSWKAPIRISKKRKRK